MRLLGGGKKETAERPVSRGKDGVFYSDSLVQTPRGRTTKDDKGRRGRSLSRKRSTKSSRSRSKTPTNGKDKSKKKKKGRSKSKKRGNSRSTSRSRDSRSRSHSKKRHGKKSSNRSRSSSKKRGSSKDIDNAVGSYNGSYLTSSMEATLPMLRNRSGPRGPGGGNFAKSRSQPTKMIDSVPSAMNYDSDDSVEELIEERSRFSRYSVNPYEEQAMSTFQDDDDVDTFDDKYSQQYSQTIDQIFSESAEDAEEWRERAKELRDSPRKKRRSAGLKDRREGPSFDMERGSNLLDDDWSGSFVDETGEDAMTDPIYTKPGFSLTARGDGTKKSRKYDMQARKRQAEAKRMKEKELEEKKSSDWASRQTEKKPSDVSETSSLTEPANAADRSKRRKGKPSRSKTPETRSSKTKSKSADGKSVSSKSSKRSGKSKSSRKSKDSKKTDKTSKKTSKSQSNETTAPSVGTSLFKMFTRKSRSSDPSDPLFKALNAENSQAKNDAEILRPAISMESSFEKGNADVVVDERNENELEVVSLNHMRTGETTFYASTLEPDTTYDTYSYSMQPTATSTTVAESDKVMRTRSSQTSASSPSTKGELSTKASTRRGKKNKKGKKDAVQDDRSMKTNDSKIAQDPIELSRSTSIAESGKAKPFSRMLTPMVRNTSRGPRTMHEAPDLEMTESDKFAMYTKSLMTEDSEPELDSISPMGKKLDVRTLPTQSMSASVSTGSKKGKKKASAIELDEYIVSSDDKKDPQLVQCLKFYYCGAAANAADMTLEAMDCQPKTFPRDGMEDVDDAVMVHRLESDYDPRSNLILAHGKLALDDGILDDPVDLAEAPEIRQPKTPSYVREVTKATLQLDDDPEARKREEAMKRAKQKAEAETLSVTSIDIPVSATSSLVSGDYLSEDETDAGEEESNVKPVKSKKKKRKKQKKGPLRSLVSRFTGQ